MSRTSMIHGIGISAIVAAGAAFSLCLSSPALAEPAQNNNTVRSNRGGAPAEAASSGSGGGAGKVSVHDISITKAYEDMGLTITELETLLATLEEQMAQLTALSSSAQETGQAIDEASSASTEASAEELARLENAKKAFDEEVASELESDVASEVSSSLEQAAASAAEGASAEETSLSSDLEELSSVIVSLQDAISELKSSSAACKAGYDLKKNEKV